MGRICEPFPEIEIEAERVVPIRAEVMPLFWVSGADPGAVEERIRSDSLVEDVQRLTEFGGRTLFQVSWRSEFDPLFTPLAEMEGAILRAEGQGTAWTLRVQFRDQQAFRECRETCADAGIDVAVRQITRPTPPEDDTLLTAAQRDALVAAHEHGYWAVPRRTTTAELADQLGISAQAVSERLRRGTDRLVDAYVAPEVVD